MTLPFRPQTRATIRIIVPPFEMPEGMEWSDAGPFLRPCPPLPIGDDMTTDDQDQVTETRYNGPTPKPLPCGECGGRVVWKYVDDGHGDIDSEGQCERCGMWY